MPGISFKIRLKEEKVGVCIGEIRLVMKNFTTVKLENNFDIFLPQVKYIPTHY